MNTIDIPAENKLICRKMLSGFMGQEESVVLSFCYIIRKRIPWKDFIEMHGEYFKDKPELLVFIDSIKRAAFFLGRNQGIDFGAIAYILCHLLISHYSTIEMDDDYLENVVSRLSDEYKTLSPALKMPFVVRVS